MNPFIATSVFPFIMVAGISAILFYFVAPIARNIGLVDRPNERKKHELAIPLIGGVGIAISFYLSLLLVPFGLGSYRYILFCMGVLFIVGVLDDHQDISAKIKFGVQILAAAIIVADGTVVTAVGDIFSWNGGNSLSLGPLAKPLTVVAIVGLVNAFNFIDGHDGLAGSLFGVSALVVVYLCGTNGLWRHQYFLLLFLVGILVFLIYNWPSILGKSRQVFLGDAGSMMLGLILAYMLIELSDRSVPAVKTTAAPWIVGIPLVDMVAVIALRLKNKISPTVPDRRHIHHLLVDLGMSKTRILAILVIVQFVFVGVGWFGTTRQVPDWIMFWSMFPVMAAYLLVYRQLARRAGRATSLISRN